MPNILFATLQAAIDRSAELWDLVKGPGWQEGDHTLYKYLAAEFDGIGPALVVNRRDADLDALILEDQLTDDELAALVSVYPVWETGTSYRVDDLAAYEDQLYRCVQAHTSQVDWTPAVVPALWVRITLEGVIPEWVQPTGAHDAYALDALVTHAGYIWRSLYAANVWEPGVFGWAQVGPV